MCLVVAIDAWRIYCMMLGNAMIGVFYINWKGKYLWHRSHFSVLLCQIQPSFLFIIRHGDVMTNRLFPDAGHLKGIQRSPVNWPHKRLLLVQTSSWTNSWQVVLTSLLSRIIYKPWGGIRPGWLNDFEWIFLQVRWHYWKWTPIWQFRAVFQM